MDPNFAHHQIRLPSLRELGLLPYPAPKPPHEALPRSARWKANPPQLSILNQVFKTNQFPSKDTRKFLSMTLKIQPRTLQIWFQNRRQALKTRTRKPTTNSSESH
ncbi:hypothetical protein DSO57_1033087 [Entomophthora muscae]|uniref:Uncharacterized protein n=1 Tax=Entomophthora muscae TaxID=34485 RepID=A0ACC2RFC2_9FUNG|nr:hypothetical protein DSO57_1033087 [Entomophthora muscae]